MSSLKRELTLHAGNRIPEKRIKECAPKYVPLDPGSTAMTERRQRRRPEEIASRAAAAYTATERRPTSIDPGFLCRLVF